MPDIDATPLIDALKALTTLLLGLFLQIVDEILGRLWNFIIRMLSINHLGQSPAIIILTLGLVCCIYVYVMKFWNR